jgi:hypothetical protein
MTGSPVRNASPAARTPLSELRALFAQCRVVPVAGVEPRVVRQFAEDPCLQVVDQAGEVRRGAGFADTAGEQSIASAVNVTISRVRDCHL